MAFKGLTNKDKKELKDVIDQMTAVSVDSFEKAATAVAHGCPRGQFLAIVNQKTENEKLNLKPLLRNLKNKVEKELGVGAFDEEEIVSILESLVRNNHDLMHYRKLIRGFDVSEFVVTKIVEIRTRSPLDLGQALFTEMFQMEGVDPSENELVGEDGKLDVEEIALQNSTEQTKSFVSPELRQTVVDIVFGIGLGVGAIALLV